MTAWPTTNSSSTASRGAVHAADGFLGGQNHALSHLPKAKCCARRSVHYARGADRVRRARACSTPRSRTATLSSSTARDRQCGEQPLPPYGLLLPRLDQPDSIFVDPSARSRVFDFARFPRKSPRFDPRARQRARGNVVALKSSTPSAGKTRVGLASRAGNALIIAQPALRQRRARLMASDIARRMRRCYEASSDWRKKKVRFRCSMPTNIC